MNPDQRIWLIRHGETAWSKTGQHTGRTDIPLLPESEAKVRELAPHLALHTFARVFSSPLKRAFQTAQLAGFASLERDDDLMEWNYGHYDGKTKDDIKALVPGWTIWTHGVTGGETLAQVAARAKNILKRAQAVSGDVALVSHGHFLRILAAVWLNLPPENAEHLALSTASISILGYENEFPALLRWNWQPGEP